VALLLMSVADLRRGLQRCRATTGLIAFYLAVLAVLLVVAFVPTLSLWLPSLLRAAAWRPTLPAVPPA
jgi:TRAP-type C4-dicarboxylate transport system permease large subunit